MNFLRTSRFRYCALLFLLLQVGFAQEVSFRITPLRPVEELRAEALKAQPPHEPGTFLKPDLVELVKLDPAIKLDIRYATTNNFLGTPLYTQARAFLQRPAAEALLRAHRELKGQGYGLISMMVTARGTSRKYSGTQRPTTKRFLWRIRQRAPGITAAAPWTCPCMI